MRAIMRWTLQQRRWSIFWWSIGIAGLVFITMVFYPSFRDQAAELEKTFQGLPDAALQLVGGSADFFSPVGFLNSQIFFITLPLLLGVLAIGLGSSLLANEEQDKTIDSLLARPVSRTRLLLAKALSGTIILLVVSLVGLITTLLMTWKVQLDLSAIVITYAFVACFLLCASFGAIAFMFSAMGKAKSAALGITSAFGLGGYLVSSLAGTVTWLEVPAKAFSFYYYQPEAILRSTYDWVYILFFVSVCGVCAIASWAAFRRRDIY